MLDERIVNFIKIPKAMKGLWDLSENRWGYKKVKNNDRKCQH